MFRLQIDTGNAAFDDPGGEYELARILKEAGQIVVMNLIHARQPGEGALLDIAGNSVGKWRNASEEEGEGAHSLPPEDSGTARPMVAAWGRPPSDHELEIIGRELDRKAPGLSPATKASVVAWHLQLVAEAAKADRERMDEAFRAGWNAHETGYSPAGRDEALKAFHINPDIFADGEEEGS